LPTICVGKARLRKKTDVKKLIFVDQATGYLSIDLMNEFAKQYDEITLLAGSIRLQDAELSPIVQRVKIARYNRQSFLLKFITWLLGFAQIAYHIFIRNNEHDIFFTTKPPFAYFLGLITRKKFSIQVLDVYPNALKLYNMSEGHIIYKIWTYLNKFIFKKASRIYTISGKMKELLLAYTPEDKIKVIPLWSGLLNLKSVPREHNEWAISQGIQNKFVVQYSGNIGYTHNVEILIDLAKQMAENKNAHFQIIGRGERYDLIKEKVEEEKLGNCSVLPFQPDEVLNQSLAAAHLGVILLDEKIAHVSLPSKIYNLQKVGVPLLCFAPEDSELRNHINKYQNGACFKENEISDVCTFILDLSKDKPRYEWLSNNSRSASQEFTTENAKKYVADFVEDEFCINK